MDNKTKAKYLGMLVQTVIRVDDSQFSQRVNPEKHDYADWIVKNMKDEELAKQIRPIIKKQEIIDFLKKTIDELNNEKETEKTTENSNKQDNQNKQETKTTENMNQNINEKISAQKTSAMEGATKAKYLNMLLQTVMRVDSNTFQTRVSNGKHDYADWILKNMKDEELSVELRRITDKQTLLEFMHYKIGEWNPELARTIKLPDKEIKEIKPTINGENEIIPAIKTKTEIKETEIENNKKENNTIEKIKQENNTIEKIKQEKTEKETENPLKELHEQHHFILSSGEKITSLPKLAELLPEMDMDYFNSHVTEYKNDFAAWIHHSIKDEALAQKIGPIKNKEEMTNIIIDRIKEHQENSIVMNTSRTDEEQKSQINKAIEQKEENKINEKNKTNEENKIKENIQTKEEIKPTKTIESEKTTTADKIKTEKTIEPKKTTEPEKATIEKITTEKKTAEKTIAEKAITTEKTTVIPTKKTPTPSINATNAEINIWSMTPTEILKKLGMIKDSTQYLALEEEIKQEKTRRKRVKTGVPGFDDMIGDGIPLNTTILMSGGPGSGKTTFCIQMLGWAAERGEKCLFMTFEETEEQLIEHMEAYGLKPREYLANGTLMIQRQDPFKISRMVEALLAHARGELLIDINEIIDILPKGYKPDRIVVDSLSAIASAFSESNTAYRIYVTKLIDLLQKTGATSFLITEVQGIEHIGHGLVEEFLADGVVVFYNLQKGNIKQSALEILKMRAVNHEKKIVPFEFVEGKGLIVYPLERTFI